MLENARKIGEQSRKMTEKPQVQQLDDDEDESIKRVEDDQQSQMTTMIKKPSRDRGMTQGTYMGKASDSES